MIENIGTTNKIIKSINKTAFFFNVTIIAKAPMRIPLNVIKLFHREYLTFLRWDIFCLIVSNSYMSLSCCFMFFYNARREQRPLRFMFWR